MWLKSVVTTYSSNKNCSEYLNKNWLEKSIFELAGQNSFTKQINYANSVNLSLKQLLILTKARDLGLLFYLLVQKDSEFSRKFTN